MDTAKIGPVQPPARPLKKVRVIVHPFCDVPPEKIEPFYLEKAAQALADEGEHLVVFSRYALDVEDATPENIARVPEALAETNFMERVRTLFAFNPERLSLCLSGYALPTLEPALSPHRWAEKLTQGVPHVLFSEDLTTAYFFREPKAVNHGVYEIETGAYTEVNGAGFVALPVSAEQRKILKRVPLDERTVSIDGRQQTVVVNREMMNRVGFVGHGQYLMVCVTDDTTRLAFRTGFGLDRIEISREQLNFYRQALDF